MEYKNANATERCVVCGAVLQGRQLRFCSEVCTKAYKRQQTRVKRPVRDHVCRCQTCGREMPIGRPRLEEKHTAREFVQPQPPTSRAIPSQEASRKEVRGISRIE